MEFIPHQYQQDAIDRMVDLKQLALLLDPGLGKTSIALTAITRLRKRTLIVAPLNICYQVWPREIKKWDHTKDLVCTILHGPEKEKRFNSKAAIYIINPEGLKWLAKTIRKHRVFPFDILIIDESTEFKNFKSKRLTEHLAPMLPAFSRRYIMSGTPITKSYLDLWAQYYILDLGARMGKTYYEYRGRYFYQTDKTGFSWDLFPRMEQDVKDLVADITIRVSGEDHLDLPEIHYNEITLTLPDPARKIYRKMMRELAVEVNGNQISAANAAVKSGKLQTIANGFLYLTDIDERTGKTIKVGVEEIHDIKIQNLRSLVTELNGNPLLVGYHYQHDLAMLKKAFPGVPYYGSGVSQQDKQKIESDWNKGKLPLLFAQVKSASKGLNLQESGYNIYFYSLVWAWVDFEQFIKRLSRQGQKSSRVIVHVPMIEKSVDYLIWETLKQRDFQSQDFLKRFVSHLMEG